MPVEFQRMSDQSVLAHFLVHANYNKPEQKVNKKKIAKKKRIAPALASHICITFYWVIGSLETIFTIVDLMSFEQIESFRFRHVQQRTTIIYDWGVPK